MFEQNGICNFGKGTNHCDSNSLRKNSFLNIIQEIIRYYKKFPLIKKAVSLDAS